MIHLKTQEEVDIMDRANRIVHEVLQRISEEAAPGVTLRELDAIAESMTKAKGGKPAFKGYHGYPASICVSVNDEVVHGIPGDRKLKEGDIVSLDFGVILDGYYGDAACTVPVGEVDEGAKKLMDVTRESLLKGVGQVQAGRRVSDVSHAVQTWAEEHGFSVVRDYVGHGIGRSLHEEPQVPNFGPPDRGPLLQKGMTLALEPMVTAGGWQTKKDSDGWTVRTADGSLAAHFEHTIAVTEGEAQVLTLF